MQRNALRKFSKFSENLLPIEVSMKGVIILNVYEKMEIEEKPIFIYGAGIMGKYIASILKKNNVQLTGFIDKSLYKQKQTMESVPVMGIREVMNQFGKDIVVIISPSKIKSIVEFLEAAGITHWHPMCDFISLSDFINSLSVSELHNARLDWIKKNWYEHYFFTHTNQLALESLDFVLTERCSLRCKECSNLMQYYQCPQNFSFHILKDEIDKILKVYDFIYELRIIGGEPFMNPETTKIIDYVAKSKKIKEICIYTNGTILPNDDDLDVLMRTNKVWFTISDYHELSKNLTKLEAKLKERGIFYQVTDFLWTRCSRICKHNRSEIELRNILVDCCVKTTVTLLNGKISPCPFIANGLNLHALPMSEEDYVDINHGSIEEINEKVRSLHSKEFYRLCDYCDGRPINPKENEFIEPHEQIKQPLDFIKVF